MTITESLLLGRQFQRLYQNLLEPICQSHQITRVELDVLLFLYNNPGYDTARDIVELRGLAKSYVSKAVELLRSKGLLEAQEDPQDRRVFHLCILPAADTLVLQAKRAQEDFFSLLFQDIPTRDRETLRRVLRKISDNIQEAL